MSVNDFKLDLVKVSKESTNSNYSVKITSYSLCTPGCKTGALMGCTMKTASCGCHVHISK
ncbi:gallidermin/nisin family lantibiotic [Lactobacillus salivarius]|uniref:Lantibiotic n=1 Tax=Ligilactobacillus salivarius TaxID=1624 RepID=A0A6B5QX47_9LACO|nr:gallidermin/nisin family lantibiotic [Ligilactobacillus salivarius]HIS18761.1 gallidermin/nisin family lantibiotic [Candidatus Coprovivens excrementavium]MBZ4025245.1 gallidermin/nisin family lantibiotic [Ligilactobacillus salivarius]MDE1500191.1 gallidermin/nisin family lantibiotic [Ligilactobacillus salivarius]MDE1542793.1 gallidermin/nisin family lantibiotic [Ligilactobacillus salivarius]MSE05756.1 gallidermin/nisin family lantibiotic [Ligilactobacillus salivarius]